MAYTVAFSNSARRTGLAGSTACVLVHATLFARISKYPYATVDGGAFGFAPQGGGTPTAMTLTTTTLDGAALGASVLVDDGSGKWRIGTVVNDGSTGALKGDGSVIPSTARAAAFLTENGQAPPPIGSELELVATAVNGRGLFAAKTTPQGQYVTDSLSTVGALGGQVAAVEVSPRTWQVVHL